ncbi:MAG: HAMP domain-containing sensor histidine kinase [Oceanidesulfovibrio sp.]
MIDYIKRGVRSLFIRLALVLLLAAVALNVVTAELFFRFRHDQDTTLTRNLVQYARFLAQELGSPPDRERAEELGQRLKMRITMDGPEQWTVGMKPRSFPEESLRQLVESDSVEVLGFHGYSRIRVRTGPNSAIIFDIFPSAAEREDRLNFGLLFLGFTCLILLAAYFLMRYLLRPVRWLTEGAASVRDGCLSCRVSEKGTGELRDLTTTFNEMVARLERVMQAQKGLLLAVSHELRTPITRLRLQLEMLDDKPSTQAMQEDVREMELLINSILEAARMQHDTGNLKRERTDMVGLLDEVARRFADQKPGVAAHLPSEPVWVDVDTDRISMLVGNLLDNAIKYSGPDATPVELHLSAANGGVVRFQVRDHGIGIPEHAVDRLFEPFFRVDESRTRESGGYGLGLSLCQAIVRAHGGEIAVESELGRGTVVTVTLPASA